MRRSFLDGPWLVPVHGRLLTAIAKNMAQHDVLPGRSPTSPKVVHREAGRRVREERHRIYEHVHGLIATAGLPAASSMGDSACGTALGYRDDAGQLPLAAWRAPSSPGEIAAEFSTALRRLVTAGSIRFPIFGTRKETCERHAIGEIIAARTQGRH